MISSYVTVDHALPCELDLLRTITFSVETLSKVVSRTYYHEILKSDSSLCMRRVSDSVPLQCSCSYCRKTIAEEVTRQIYA